MSWPSSAEMHTMYAACPPSLGTDSDTDPTLATRYQRVRAATDALSARLQPEDSALQSMPECSPAKWHLAHTSWFFEQFVLSRDPHYQVAHPRWMYLFNSYYQSVGAMHARAERGLLSRPTLTEIREYRRHVDAAMLELLAKGIDTEAHSIAVVGLNHEQQHQELLLTDLKHLFSRNPLQPAYLQAPARDNHTRDVPLRYVRGRDGLAEIGHAGDGFAFDNECPRHQVLLHPHTLANRPVNNREYQDFIHDGGYRNAGLWMAEGWALAQTENWQRPLYWAEDHASTFGLFGRRELDPLAPVCHVSFYEADAFARWAGARLPTEAEWEVRAQEQAQIDGNFQESGQLEPLPPVSDTGMLQLFGDVWEWTSSPYVNYPGFQPWSGSLGEYNAKFMCGQWVLRGGSCLTPQDHIRASYRNFFYPRDRWQCTGIRLGKNA